VRGSILRITEHARGFEHNVRTQLAPGDIGGIALRIKVDFLTVHDQAVLRLLDGSLKAPIRGIVAKQKRKSAGRIEVINRYNVDLVRILGHHAFERLASDATKSIDTNLDCHHTLLFPLQGLDGTLQIPIH